MEIALVVITGLIMGFVNAFFGIGGGSVMLPIFYSAFAYMTPALAIPIALGSIFLNCVMNSHRYYKAGIFPSKRTVIIFIFAGIAGTALGTLFVRAVDAVTAKKFLGLVLLLVTLRIAFSKQHMQEQQELKEPPLGMGLACFFSSMLSAMTGLGGGIILVPVFIMMLKMPLKFVTPFSNVTMAISSFIGVIPYLFTRPDLSQVPDHLHTFYLGSVNLLFVALLFVSGMPASKWGVRWNNTIGPKPKKIMLVILIGALSMKILIG